MHRRDFLHPKQLAGAVAQVLDVARELRSLERELAAYGTPAQRCDLEATFDRYPDDATGELRDILARQAAAAGRH